MLAVSLPLFQLSGIRKCFSADHGISNLFLNFLNVLHSGTYKYSYPKIDHLQKHHVLLMMDDIFYNKRTCQILYYPTMMPH